MVGSMKSTDFDKFDPEVFESLYATAYWLYQQLRVEKAIPIFLAMIQIDASDERGWIGLGACNECLDNNATAQFVYEAGLLKAKNHTSLQTALNRVRGVK